MWPQWAHILAPLSSELRKKTFLWTPDVDLAFKCMKALMAWDCLLAYPNHNKPLHIYTDTSSYQMDACIVQDNKPVAFCSCKLNDAQLCNTVDDKELLSIVMVWQSYSQCSLVQCYTSIPVTLTLPLITPLLIASYVGSIMLNNSTLTSNLSPTKTMSLLTKLSWLDHLEESILLKDKQVFVLKDSISLPTIHSSLSAFYTCHPCSCTRF